MKRLAIGRVAAAVLMCAMVGACTMPGTKPAKPPDSRSARLSGVITWRDDQPLRGDAVVKVWLQDRSRADLPVPDLLDELVIERPGLKPIPFTLRYDPATIRERGFYAIYVRVFEGDRIRLLNATVYPVITRGCTADCTVVVDRIR
jgi:putative lipoprotein